MFDLLGGWREAIHVTEWSGLAIGTIAGLGVLAWYVAPARRLAIAGGIVVAVGYGCVMHGARLGRADVQARWEAARTAETEAAKQRDIDAERSLDAKYQPIIAELEKRAADRQQQVKQDAQKPRPTAAGGCLLGAGPLRLRNGQ